MEGLRILVVDDDVDFRAALARGLREAGHVVCEADGADQALRGLPVARPDVLITDILMPDGDGIELIRGVKAIQGQVPIVAISGRRRVGSLDLLDLASKLGAQAVLSKPFSMDEILATLESLFVPPPSQRRGV